MKVEVRPAVVEDEAFLESLFRLKASEDLGFAPLDPLIDLQVRARNRQFGGRFADPSAWLIEVDGARVGSYQLEPGQNRHLSYFAILPEYRGKGIGTEVLRRLQAEGGDILLYVTPWNTARKLYERMGFVVERQEDASILMRWAASPVC